MEKKDFINEFIKKKIIKYGDFTLKSGKKSNIYIDMRTIISYPTLLKNLTTYIAEKEKKNNVKVLYSIVCGVPYGAISLATAFSLETNIKSIFIRKEKKEYGTKKQIEGHFTENEEILLIEDVITSGQSILETIQIIEQNNLKIGKIITFIDREEGGVKMLRERGYNIEHIFKKSDFFTLF